LDTLIKSLKAGFASHAYIFLGADEETSRRTMLLAKTVNCENVVISPCGICKNCRKIEAGTHPDIFEIYPEGSSIKIDQVRRIILSLSERPMEGKKKVYVLHEAHKMTPEAQNSLLKSLEEPATASILVLLSESLKQLLPTVISRCQVYDFSAGRGPLLPFETRQKMGKLVLSLAEKKEFDPGAAVRELTGIGEKTEELLEFLSSLYRDILAVKTKSRAPVINDDLSDIVSVCSDLLSIKSVVKSLDLIFSQLKAAKSRGNQNLIWYNLLTGLQEVM
jgi:DNA polymerase-3 subunit delta'